MPQSKTYIKSAGSKGRGVFAAIAISKGQIIEIAPYIHIPAAEYDRVADTTLSNYWYGANGRACAIGLGNTSLYNHSDAPNADYAIRTRSKTIKIVALENMAVGQEICIDYGYDPGAV
jgi:SET domain-containing protein